MRTFSILLVLIILPVVLSACSCMRQTMGVKKILNYDLVFHGVIIDKSTIAPGEQSDDLILDIGQFRYLFEIKELYRGKVKTDTVTVYSSIQSSACGVNYEVGDEYFIYSHIYEGTYRTGLCSFNVNRKQAKKRYRKLLCQFKKNKKIRFWKDENGQLMANGKSVDNIAMGEWIFYHVDGSIDSKGAFVDGEKHGEWIEYMSPRERREYEMHNPNHAKQVDQGNGQLISRRIKYDNGERIAIKN